MKIDSIICEQELYEANVFNIKVEHGGVSVVGYLKQIADNLPNQELQTIFIKKITSLLVNDERFLYALRDLPNDAPEWAREAVAAQQLYVFQPTEELNDLLNHIAHYLSGATDDAKNSQSNDTKVFAQRELAAFSKAENLQTLAKKSQEFFQRGSRGVGHDTQGMDKIFDAGDGYTWYKLVSLDAFRKEGKVLQNCIGSHYTPSKLEEISQAIVVMKTSENESVVAMRIHVPTHTVHEAKGKNNQPPVEKYMEGVVRLIQHMKLTLIDSAIYDMKRAGYFYDEDTKELLTRPRAIQKWVTSEKISNVPNTQHTVIRAKVQNIELRNELYDMMSYGLDRASLNSVHVYELRGVSEDKEQALVFATAIVDPVKSQVSNLVVSGKSTKAGTELIQELSKAKIIKSLAPIVQRQILWQQQQNFHPTTGEFEPVSDVDQDVQTDKSHLKWKLYSDPRIVAQFYELLRSSIESYTTAPLNYQLEEIKQIYITTDQVKHADKQIIHVILQTNTNVLIPMRVLIDGSNSVGASTEFVGYQGWSKYTRGGVDQRVVNSLIGLANKEDLKLPKTVRLSHGIVRDEKGQYEKFKPSFKKVSGQIPAEKLDISNLTPGNRLAALTGAFPNKIGGSHSRDLFGINDYFGQQHRFYNRKSINADSIPEDDTVKWEKGQLTKLHNMVFRGGTPDAVYKVKVKYGADKEAEILLLTDSDKIIRIDNVSTQEKWQKWSDLDKITSQLNTFADEHNLKYTPQSTLTFKQSMELKDNEATVKARQHQNEFRVIDGKLTTASAVKQSEIESQRLKGKYASEGTDELKFADNAKLVRMNPTEQSEWVRRVMYGEGGRAEAWKIYNKDGEYRGILLVDNGKIRSMYGSVRRVTGDQTDNTKDPNRRGIVFNLLPYIKAAADVFNWKPGSTSTFNLKPKSKLHYALRQYEHRSRRKTSVLLTDVDQYLVGSTALTRTPIGGSSILTISEYGKKVLAALNNGTAVNILNNISGAKKSDDFVAPVRKEPPKKAPRATKETGTVKGKGQLKTSTAPPRTGTATEKALIRFKSMTKTLERIPTKGEFMQVLQAAPFNMSKFGAQTYYYTTKAKYAALGESFSPQAAWELLIDLRFRSFKSFLIG
jgi:hypothetical protein